MKKTLNLGCGERVYEEYPKNHTCINLDARDLDCVDVVADVRSLPYEDEVFDYILASDIIEHFPISETLDLLNEWQRVLKHGGLLELRTPNLHWAAEHYMQHGDAKFISYHLFGGQNYPGNFHQVVFDGKWLTELCSQTGLLYIEHEFKGSNIILKVYKR